MPFEHCPFRSRVGCDSGTAGPSLVGWRRPGHAGSRLANRIKIYKRIRLHERLLIDSCASAVGRERGWDVRGLLVESLVFFKGVDIFLQKVRDCLVACVDSVFSSLLKFVLPLPCLPFAEFFCGLVQLMNAWVVLSSLLLGLCSVDECLGCDTAQTFCLCEGEELLAKLN